MPGDALTQTRPRAVVAHTPTCLHKDDKLIKSAAQVVQRDFVCDGNLWASLAESQEALAETSSKDPHYVAEGSKWSCIKH